MKSCDYHVTTRFVLLSHVIVMLPPGLCYQVMLLQCYHQVWAIASCYCYVTTRFGLLSEVIALLPPGLGY